MWIMWILRIDISFPVVQIPHQHVEGRDHALNYILDYFVHEVSIFVAFLCYLCVLINYHIFLWFFVSKIWSTYLSPFYRHFTLYVHRLFRFSAYSATQYYILGREITHECLQTEGGVGTTYIIESGPFVRPKKNWR